jgi:hypothetical protein
LLVVLDDEDIRDYASNVFEDDASSNLEAERQKCLASDITGSLQESSLANARHPFRAYLYMSERFQGPVVDGLFAWPAFVVAQKAVIGK